MGCVLDNERAAVFFFSCFFSLGEKSNEEDG